MASASNSRSAEYCWRTAAAAKALVSPARCRVALSLDMSTLHQSKMLEECGCCLVLVGDYVAASRSSLIRVAWRALAT